MVALSLTLGACSQVSESQTPQLEGTELASALADEGIFLLDVREPSELEELGTVEGYVNIPIDQLADRLDELPRDKRILTA
jgi:rhodanese-related sulfurtransferase